MSISTRTARVHLAREISLCVVLCFFFSIFVLNSISGTVVPKNVSVKGSGEKPKRIFFACVNVRN